MLRTRERVDLFLASCLELVLAESPRIVGFTSVFQQHTASLALAKRVKNASPETLIVFGGPNCDDVLGIETIRQFPFVDAVVLGEGDLVFPELVRRHLSGEPVTGLQGVYTRSMFQGVVIPPKHYAPAPIVRNMDLLPLPTYEDYIEQLGRTSLAGQFLPEIPFETSRGCWWGQKHHCTFCGINDELMAFRSKSAGRVIDDLLKLHERYPRHRMTATDEIMSPKYYTELLPQLAARNPGFNLYYEVKANLTEHQLRAMKAAGLRAIQPGIESLSTEVLGSMRKGVTAIQNLQLLKWCETMGITCYWNYLWGFPSERPEAYADMSRLVPLLSHFRPPDWMGRIALVRFSPYFETPEDFGIENVSPAAAYGFVYPLAAPAVSNLAYYFTFSYRDARQPERYTEDLAKAILQWRSAHNTSCLFCEDLGSTLIIWDLRPVALHTITELTGVDKEIYVRCDRASSLAGLREAFPALNEADIDASLQRLLEARLMVYLDDRYLALAIDLGEYRFGRCRP